MNTFTTLDLEYQLSQTARIKLTRALDIIKAYNDSASEWDQKMARVIPTFSKRKMRFGAHRAAEHRYLLSADFNRFASATVTACKILGGLSADRAALINYTCDDSVGLYGMQL